MSREVTCPRCHHVWMYKGSNPYVVTCSKCKQHILLGRQQPSGAHLSHSDVEYFKTLETGEIEALAFACNCELVRRSKEPPQKPNAKASAQSLMFRLRDAAALASGEDRPVSLARIAAKPNT